MKPNSDTPVEPTLQPYSSYKPSPNPWVGQIPQHWQAAPGKAVYLTKQMINVGMRESTVLSLSYGRLRIRDEAELHGLVPASFETYQIIQPGDIVCRPTDLQNDWNSLRFGHSNYQGIITSAYLCLQTRPGIDPRYGHLLLHAYDLKKVFYGLGSGLRQNLGWSDFKYLPCLVPPLEEQAAIVRYLDHADELINRYISAKQRLIALLEEQRQAVIHQAVTRGLDPNAPSKQSSVEWLADVPQHWQLPEIKQVSKILRGKFTHRPRNDPSLYGGIYPFIQTGDVAAANGIIRTHRQTLNQRGLAVSTMFPAGTLVMTIAANIGDVAVLNFEACFPDSIVGFVPTNKVERDFLYYLFRAMKSEFLREAPVNTQGNLNVERIGSRKIPLPSVDEQVTIVRHLAEVSAHIDASMELAHRQVSLIGEYRTRLIADVVTGQIAVRDAVVELPGQHL